MKSLEVTEKLPFAKHDTGIVCMLTPFRFGLQTTSQSSWYLRPLHWLKSKTPATILPVLHALGEQVGTMPLRFVPSHFNFVRLTS